jgi:hypothetical protein
VRFEKLLTLTRDTLSLLIGAGGIVYQQATGSVEPALLTVYVTLLGAPMGIGLLSAARRGRTDTTESSSPSVEPQPPLRSSSPASGQAEA